MSPIEIKITPRKIERWTYILIILLLLGALYYYGFRGCDCAQPSIATEGEEIDAIPEVQEDTEVVEKVVKPTPAPKPVDTSGIYDGKIRTSVKNIDFSSSGDADTWRVDEIVVSVTNGKETTQTGIQVDIYKYGPEDDPEIRKVFKPLNHPKSIDIGPVIAGGTVSRKLSLTNPALLYDKGKTYDFKIVFKQNSDIIGTVTKKVTPT
jgi:hypothetical protein